MANVWRIHLRKGGVGDSVSIGNYCINHKIAAMGWILESKNADIKSGKITINSYTDYEYYAADVYGKVHDVRRLAEEVKPGDYIWTYYDKIYYLAKVGTDSKYYYNASDEAIQNDACNQLTNIDWKAVGDKKAVDERIRNRLQRGNTLQRLFNPKTNKTNFDFALKYTKNIYNKNNGFLFGYKMDPAYGCYEITEGYSFMIQADGKAVYNRFVMSGRQLSSETIQIEDNIVAELKEYLYEKESMIKKLPGETYNHSCDGAYDTFTFLGKSMTSLNATIVPITGSPKNEFEKQMIPTLQAENNAIEIFLGGIEILKKSNVKFSVKSWEEFEFWSIDKDNVTK